MLLYSKNLMAVCIQCVCVYMCICTYMFTHLIHDTLIHMATYEIKCMFDVDFPLIEVINKHH